MLKFLSLREFRKLNLADLEKSTSRALAKAKKRFHDARREATKAFANEALKLSDRMLAMRYRVAATILETVDNPEDALAVCRVCMEDLHSLPAVQKSFNIELKKSFWAWFNKVERGEIISTVCLVNRVIYDVMLMVDFGLVLTSGKRMSMCYLIVELSRLCRNEAWGTAVYGHLVRRVMS